MPGAYQRNLIALRSLTRQAARLTELYKSRAKVLQGDALRTTLQMLGHETVDVYRVNIESFNPGKVKDLNEQYKKQKQKDVGFTYPILVRTRQLWESFYSRVIHSGSKWTIQVGTSPDRESKSSTGQVFLEYVTNSQLAQWHRDGMGRNPKRDFTKMPPRWRQRWQGIIRKAIKDLSRPRRK